MSGTLEGGRNGHTGGFAANPELARIAGAKGGKKSKRGPAKRGGRVINANYTKDQLERIREELGWNDDQSTAALSEDWEVYKPKEPLIKDEKIRKAIRAWAEACNLKHVTYKQASNEFYDADTRGAFAIRFTLMPVEVYLEDGESFTIDELCEEEEG